VAGHTKMVYPQTINCPSINWARRRVTTLTKTNALPLSQASTSLLSGESFFSLRFHFQMFVLRGLQQWYYMYL